MPYLGKQPNKSATSTIGNGVAEDTMLKFASNKFTTTAADISVSIMEIT